MDNWQKVFTDSNTAMFFNPATKRVILTTLGGSRIASGFVGLDLTHVRNRKVFTHIKINLIRGE